MEKKKEPVQMIPWNTGVIAYQCPHCGNIEYHPTGSVVYCYVCYGEDFWSSKKDSSKHNTF